MTIGLENIINVDVASDWMKTQTLGSLPMMRVELFFEMPNLPKFEKYFGEKYLGAQNVSKYGIKMVCAPNANRNEDIAKTIHDRKCTTFPFELYEVQFSTFGRDQYSGYERPCHFLYVDNTAINTARALRYVIESTYQNAVEEVDRASTQYQFRQHVSCFKLPQSALGKNLTVIGDLTSCLDIKDKGVSLANCGEGKISICKTKSALDKRVTDVSILALEEPENHLSHYNLRHLISMVRNRAEDNQLFIVTHSSYITSRLGLQNAFFVRNGNVSSLSKLSPDTSDFFMKAPNDNLLQFVLSRKVILVEGAAEYILMDKFIREVMGMETSPTDIWIMAGFSPASAILRSNNPTRTLHALYVTMPTDVPYGETAGGSVLVFDTSTGTWKIMICLSAHQTTDNIRKNKAFTVSFATVETVTASDYVGIVSQKNEPNKIAKSGLVPVKANKVNAPLFSNYPLTLECEVEDIINEGEGGGNIIGNIVNVSADESVLTNGKLDSKKLHVIAFDPSSAAYISLGEEVAKAFREGTKLK